MQNPVSRMPDGEQLDIESLRALKAQCPDHTVVAYINTTSELKTECGCLCDLIFCGTDL